MSRIQGVGAHYVGQVLFDIEAQNADELSAKAGEQLVSGVISSVL